MSSERSSSTTLRSKRCARFDAGAASVEALLRLRGALLPEALLLEALPVGPLLLEALLPEASLLDALPVGLYLEIYFLMIKSNFKAYSLRRDKSWHRTWKVK